MIFLDTTKIKTFENQPKIYNSEEELIEWLKYDLYKQALDKGKSPDENNIIVISDEEEKYYTLNIGTYKYIIDISCDLLNLIISNFLKIIDEKAYIDYNIHIINVNLSLFFNFNNIIYNGSLIFDKVIFYSKISFNNSTYNKIFRITNSEFKQPFPLEINNTYFNNGFSFCNNKLNSILKITKVKFNSLSYFISNNFHYPVIFSRCEINNIINFYTSTFGNLEFNFSSFNGIINFIGSIIEKLIFNEINFKDKYSILKIENNEYDDFYNYLIDDMKKENEKIDSIDNIIYSMDFKYIRISGMVYFQNININEVDFKGSVIDGGILNPVNFKVEKFANRESALFLKQHAIINNNSIDALQYHALEVVEHKKELLEKPDKTLKDYGDILSIYLSSLFSDNGLNWIKALMMTLLFPIIFFIISYMSTTTALITYSIFTIYLISSFLFKDMLKYVVNSILIYIIACALIPKLYFYYLEIYNNLNFYKDLLSFLTPTNFNQILQSNCEKDCSYIFKDENTLNIIVKSISYFLGKVAFWYGSFHTVAAFRKFNRAL